MKKKKKRSYKATIQETVHKVGSQYIDQMSISLYYTDKWPIWFEQLCKSFSKQPKDVANDMIRYRNSMGYVYKEMGI